MSTRRVCPNCGNILQDNDIFCGNCGTKFPESFVQSDEKSKARPRNIILLIALVAVAIIAVLTFAQPWEKGEELPVANNTESANDNSSESGPNVVIRDSKILLSTQMCDEMLEIAENVKTQSFTFITYTSETKKKCDAVMTFNRETINGKKVKVVSFEVITPEGEASKIIIRDDSTKTDMEYKKEYGDVVVSDLDAAQYVKANLECSANAENRYLAYINDTSKFKYSAFDIDTKKAIEMTSYSPQMYAFTADLKRFCERAIPSMLNKFFSQNGSDIKVQDYGLSFTD